MSKSDTVQVTPLRPSAERPEFEWLSPAQLKGALRNCVAAWGNMEGLAEELRAQGVSMSRSRLSDLCNVNKPNCVPDLFVVWRASVVTGDATLHRQIGVSMGLGGRERTVEQAAIEAAGILTRAIRGEDDG